MQETRAGVPCGRFRFYFTPPNSIEYWQTQFDRVWNDPNWNDVQTDLTIHAAVGTPSAPSVSDQVDWWPLPSAPQNLEFRARTLTRAGISHAGVWSAGVVVPAGAPVGPQKPTQPVDGSWSAVVAENGADPYTGKPKSRVQVTVTSSATDAARASGATLYTAWIAKGIAGDGNPRALTAFQPIANQPLAAPGATLISWWADREPDHYWLWILITASAAGYYTAPEATSYQWPTPILAPTDAGPATSFSVQILTENRGGTPSGRFQFTWIAPNSAEYWQTLFDRGWCTDAGYGTVVQWDQTVHGAVGTKGVLSASVQEDWWPLPSAPQYLKFRARTLTRAGLDNVGAAPTFNITVPTSSGITKLDPSAGKKGIAIDGDGGIVLSTDNTANLVSNPGFEHDTKDWYVYSSGSGGIVTSPTLSGTKALKLWRAPNNWAFFWQLKPIAVRPGEEYHLEAWVKGDDNGLGAGLPSTGNVTMVLRASNNPDTPDSTPEYSAYGNLSLTAQWQKLTAILKVPEGWRWLWVYPVWTSEASGPFYVDHVSLWRLEPLGNGVMRDAQGNLLVNYNNQELRMTTDGKLEIAGLDFTKALTNKLANYFEISGSQFKVKYEGLPNDVLQNIAAHKIQAGTLAAGVVYAGSVAASQIQAGTLAAGVIYTGTINAGQVNAGDFNGRGMVLDRYGVTTTITHDYVDGYYNGIKLRSSGRAPDTGIASRSSTTASRSLRPPE